MDLVTDNSIIQLKFAIDSSDTLFITDDKNNRVQVFNSDGGYITQFGNQGSTSEIIQDPGGIAVDSSGNVYVGDGIDSDLHVFSPVK